MLKSLLGGLKSLFHSGGDGPGLMDRRGEVRFTCDIEVECADPKGRERWPARVVDVGPGGLRLLTERELAIGQELTTSYRPGGEPVGRQRLRCRVVWRHQNLAGLQYVDNEKNVKLSWVFELLAELGFDESRVFRRKAMRVETRLPLTLTLVDESDRELSGEVVNLGVGGALVLTPEQLEEKSRATFEIGPNGRLPLLKLFGYLLVCRRSDSGDGWLTSARFLNREGKEVDLLGKYVLALLKEQHS